MHSRYILIIISTSGRYTRRNHDTLVKYRSSTMIHPLSEMDHRKHLFQAIIPPESTLVSVVVQITPPMTYDST